MWHKTKKQRRKWWNSLTEDQQAKHLDKWTTDKKEKRRARNIAIMDKAEIKHNCKTCFHGITKNCEAGMKWGCEYWFNPQSSITGLAYPQEEENKDIWWKTIKNKNKWLKVA